MIFWVHESSLRSFIRVIPLIYELSMNILLPRSPVSKSFWSSTWNGRAEKAQASLRIRAVSPEPLLLAQITWEHWCWLWLKLKPLVPLDSCAYMCKEWLYAYSLSTKIFRPGPFWSLSKTNYDSIWVYLERQILYAFMLKILKYNVQIFIIIKRSFWSRSFAKNVKKRLFKKILSPLDVIHWHLIQLGDVLSKYQSVRMVYTKTGKHAFFYAKQQQREFSYPLERGVNQITTDTGHTTIVRMINISNTMFWIVYPKSTLKAAGKMSKSKMAYNM